MKFLHISDLHIGRQLNGYSLSESQEDAFDQIIGYTISEKPNAVLLCGDIYDKSIPSAKAYTVLDRFLNRLSEAAEEIPVFMISGNHDSPERLAYASSFLERKNIYVSAFPPAEREDRLKKITLKDRWGNVNFYLFPFIRPGYVRHLFEEGVVTDYESAFRAVLSREEINLEERNVILAHQFFTAGGEGPDTCESETAVLVAGGLDKIDISVLEPFDYAALGHIHGPQRVGEERFRYSGTPYKYSASEEHHRKSVTAVTLEEKGSAVRIETLPLTCVPEVRRVKGKLSEVKELAKTGEKTGYAHDFVSITLTDETEIYDFREQLEENYDHIMEIRIDNERTRQRMKEDGEAVEVLSPIDAFRHFYEAVRHCPMSRQQEEIMKQIVEEAKEEGRQ